MRDIKVLGIDPALRRTGYAIISLHKNEVKLLDKGMIISEDKEEIMCLRNIIYTLKKKVFLHKPSIGVIEGSYVGINFRTSVACAKVIGAIESLFIMKKIPIIEMSGKTVKKIIVGYGAATKFDIARIVREELALEDEVPLDVSDACACALAFIKTLQILPFRCSLKNSDKVINQFVKDLHPEF